MKRTILVGAALATLIAACGGAMTADEYVEDLNALSAIGRADFEAAATSYERVAEPTLADEVAFLDQEVSIRRVFLAGFEELDPPDSIAEVHRLLGNAFVRLTEAAEGLAAAAKTVGSVAEAEQTPAFAEYLASNTDGAIVCLDVQARLDELAASGEALDDVPWIAGLELVVQAALGCGEIETG